MAEPRGCGGGGHHRHCHCTNTNTADDDDGGGGRGRVIDDDDSGTGGGGGGGEDRLVDLSTTDGIVTPSCRLQRCRLLVSSPLGRRGTRDDGSMTHFPLPKVLTPPVFLSMQAFPFENNFADNHELNTLSSFFLLTNLFPRI